MRLSMLLGRRRAWTSPEVEEIEPTTGFPTRRPSAWGDDEPAEAELRRRHGRGTNYLVIDQVGTAGSTQL